MENKEENKKVFRKISEKELIKKTLPYILSYLRANPNDDKYTDIFATSIKSKSHYRCDNIGNAQFQIKYNEIKNKDGFCRVDFKNIRIENNVYENTLSLFEKSFRSISKSDFIIFGDWLCKYISISSESFGNSWVNDSKYYKIKPISLPYGKQYVYEYDIEKLLEDGHIYKILEYSKDQKIFSLWNGTWENPNKIDITFLSYYKNVTEKIDKIILHKDPRTASYIYFTFWGYRYTNNSATIPNLAKEIHKITGDPVNNIQQKLYKAKQIMRKEDRAKPVIFDLSEIREKYIIEGLQYDPDIIEDHKLIVFISFEKGWDIVDHQKELKTENMKEYQKEYKEKTNESQKKYHTVYVYLKRHNNQYNPKWTSEQIEIANKILSK